MQYIEMICFNNAQQDYDEAIKYSKCQVLLDYSTEMVQENNVNNNDCTMFEIDDNEHVRLTSNNAAFMTWMNKPAAQIHANEVTHMGWITAAKTRLMKWRHFEIHFRNHLNVIIFRKKYHKAREVQIEYMQYRMTKPFGAKVAQCYRRVDLLANLLNYFPPTSTRDEILDIQAWDLALCAQEVGKMMSRKI